MENDDGVRVQGSVQAVASCAAQVREADGECVCSPDGKIDAEESLAVPGRVIAAVVCTGQSVTQADVDYLRGKCKVVVVSDAYKLAPWADVMVSHDRKWWEVNEDCDFPGPRYCAAYRELPERYGTRRFYPAGGNSGCMGILVAQKLFKPWRILLMGADLHGTHYFGPHTKPRLHNTTKAQFLQMKKQYGKLSKLPVVNCSPISALTCFPKMALRDVL